MPIWEGWRVLNWTSLTELVAKGHMNNDELLLSKLEPSEGIKSHSIPLESSPYQIQQPYLIIATSEPNIISWLGTSSRYGCHVILP